MPQANTPPASLMADLSSSVPNSTRQNVSTKSDVPQALLMAREDSFGIVRPCDATMDTTMGVILFPGMPPRLWKSYSSGMPKSTVSPVEAMALVRAATSSRSELLTLNAETKDSISLSESPPSCMSDTMEPISSALSFPPFIFFLMDLTDSGRGEKTMSTTSPSDTEQRSIIRWGIITVPLYWSESDTATEDIVVLPPVILTRSVSSTPSLRQSSLHIITNGSEVRISVRRAVNLITGEMHSPIIKGF